MSYFGFKQNPQKTVSLSTVGRDSCYRRVGPQVAEKPHGILAASRLGQIWQVTLAERDLRNPGQPLTKEVNSLKGGGMGPYILGLNS